MLQSRMPPLIRIARIALLALALAALVSPHVEVLSGGRGAAAIAPAQRVAASHGIVVAQEARAARIGAEILAKGGNAVDAAVAVGFALAVTWPEAGNIGGGGFMLIHRADRNDDVAIDYRETAPAATTPTIFLDQDGNADPAKSRNSALGIGVPGTVAGLALAQQKFGSGRFSLADGVAPAIELARAGIPVEDDTAAVSPPTAAARFARWPGAAKIFLKGNGLPLGPGDRLVQSDLAATLATIAREGPSAFYDGPIAEKIAAAVAANGGLMTREDLKNYRAVEREPVRWKLSRIRHRIDQPVVERPRTSQRHNRTRLAERTLQVLVAEDNQVNQMVATRIFQKLGHQVTVVSNGREALSAVQAVKFDLIAMDVQMPEMDGLDATSAIRSWEKAAGTHIPIMAMTAHAMKGDRERCLAAGMDGYTSKPIRIRELEQAIAQLTSPPKPSKAPVSEGSHADGVIDHAALLAGVDGDRRLLRELVRLFLVDCPKRLAEIKEAIRRGDAGGLGRAAHTLKGSVGNFAAQKAFAASQRLENMGRDGELGSAREACVTLESELKILSDELRRFISLCP